MNERLYQLKQEFLDTWPIQKLEQMTLEEYTNLVREDSFCYWLEHVTRDLGSIVGGSSYKFGIYKMADSSKTEKASNRNNNGEYAWHNKYGNTQEEAFQSIKNILVRIASAAQANTLEVIDIIDLGHAYKWKIAFMYGDFNCLNAFKLDALRVIATNLGIEYTNKTPFSKLHKDIIKSKPDDLEFFSWSRGLWQQYQTGLIDVKKDFANWLNANTFESYRAYLGYTNKSIEERLDEINNHFDDLDFFLVDPKNVSGLVSSIQFLLSKDERGKNPEFVEYDSKNNNGIPKAILGETSYIKFLKERYGYQTPNYWVFQGNPNIYNISNALKSEQLKSWKVAAHKENIQVGDQVIIWQTGNQAGCYALAEVASEVSKFSEEDFELQHYVNAEEGSATNRVKLKITKSLAENPILWEDIKDIPTFSNFKAGNQGTNFSATEEEFSVLQNWNKSNDIKYWLYAPGRNAEHWESFYNQGIMAIGWDEIGDLSQYDSKESIFKALKDNYGGEGDKKNDVTANYEFYHELKKGDVVIVKKGRKELLGYGIVLSEYYHDDSRTDYQNCRNVDWKLSGSWEVNHNLVLKTLTDVTTYKSELTNHEFYYQDLMGIMNGEILNATSNSTDVIATNQILYGPPGTGKTYYLKDQLFDKYTIKETSISQEKFFEETVSSLTWWQVITLALLEIGTARVNDILENRWVVKKSSLSESKNVRATLWGTLQMHTIIESKNVAYTQRQAPLIFDKNEDKSWSLLDSELKEQAPELLKVLDRVNNFKANPEKVIKNYSFVTFHQSFAYEDFIEGIKPIISETEVEEAKDLGYTIEDGVFKQLCTKAKNDPDNRYAIFIDEINRGNVSAIFGELITLIEIDKRKGAQNELSIKLPYSKNEFSVPSNLDIYGTMNTADRSVEALDTALRRRFDFKEMMPDYEVIENEFVEDLDLSAILRTINQRIELLIDRDHTIGHSYFVGVDTKQKLANAFNNKIMPLLQEYFYGDYGKIGLILGNGFVDINKNQEFHFANFKYENANDFKTASYQLKRVYEDTVLEAVSLLLGTNEFV